LGEKFILSETKWSRRKPRGGATLETIVQQFALCMICRSVIFDTTHLMRSSKHFDVR
jgi:hypothetical protein